MKYKIYDKINKEYLPFENYCINQDGYVMTIHGEIFMNQDDFNVIVEKNEMHLKKDELYLCHNYMGKWEYLGDINRAYCFHDLKFIEEIADLLEIKDYEII